MSDPYNSSLNALLRRLWVHIIPRRRIQLFLLFVLIIVASFAEVLSLGAVLPFLGVLANPESVFRAEILQPLIKALGYKDPKQLLLPLTLSLILAGILSNAVRLGVTWAQTRLGHAIGSDLSVKIYKNTLYQPYSVHNSRNSSEIISAISGKANALVNNTILPILQMMSSVFLLSSIMVGMFVIDPLVSATAFIGFGTIYVIILSFVRGRIQKDSKIASREAPKVLKALQEGLGGIRDILLDGSQSVYCHIYQDADFKLRRARAKTQVLGAAPRFLIDPLAIGLFAGLAFFLANNQNGFTTAIPILGALALAAQRLIPILQQTYAGYVSMKGDSHSLQDALALLEQPLPHYANLPEPAPISFDKAISLRNISFRYNSEAPLVINDLSLEIPKGSRIGFIGTTGSGKSTLLDIIMGLVDPISGGLCVDGTQITDKNLRSWQVRIAHVPQMVFLADTSVAENIAFGVPYAKIDWERVNDAARRACISDTIESMPLAYKTLVGERGIRLSGGQRQRIGIARALYKNADVIVFDEATSALDNETEQEVMKAIENLGDHLTIVIVAHRLTTLRKCTSVVELAKGSIQRIGSYSEIVENKYQAA